MPSRVYSFTDPYAFAAAMRGTDISLVLRDKGDFRAAMTTIDFDRLWMSRSEENIPAIFRTAPTTQRTTVAFASDTEQGSLRRGRLELSPGETLIYGPEATNYYRTEGALRLAGMSLPTADLIALTEAIAGRAFSFTSDPLIIRPAETTMSSLMNLHEAVGRLARTAPDLLGNPSVAKALEQTLVHLLVRCLASPLQHEMKCDTDRYTKVVTRFEDFLESKLYEPVYLAEICAAIGVSERILRTRCQEQLGVGPVRYLWLRRMNMARCALLRADSTKTTVTAVATDHGFWELGRFSVEYRTLFGESPSISLHRPPDRPHIRE